MEEIEHMVKEIVNNADYNQSGQIDYTEYLVSAIQKEKLVTKDKLQKAFQSFDLVARLNEERRRPDLKGRVGEVLRKPENVARRLALVPGRSRREQGWQHLDPRIQRFPRKDNCQVRITQHHSKHLKSCI